MLPGDWEDLHVEPATYARPAASPLPHQPGRH